MAKKASMVLLVIFALLAALANSVNSIANKMLVRPDGVAALPAGLLLQVVSGGFTLAALLIFRPVFVWASWPYFAAVIVISLAGFILISYGFAREDASAAGPIMGIKVLVTAVLESALQGHGVGLGVVLGAVLSVVALAFVSQGDVWSLRPRDMLRPGLLMMVLAAVSFGICDMFVRQVIILFHGTGWVVSLYIVTFTAVVCIILLAFLARRGGSFCGVSCAFDLNAVRRNFGTLASGGAANVLTQVFLFSAFAIGGQITLTNILYNSRGLILVILLAIMVLGHGHDVEKARGRAYLYRLIGALLTIGAVAVALVVK